MILHLYVSALPISALLMFFYPLLRYKTMSLSCALRHSTVFSVLLLTVSHLMLFFSYAYVHSRGMIFGAELPIPLVFFGIALMFALSCLILVAIFGCSRAVLRKLIPQE